MFWKMFHQKYGNPQVRRLHIPIGYLGDFSNHYLLYDNQGDVHDSAKTILEAISKHKNTGLYISKIND